MQDKRTRLGAEHKLKIPPRGYTLLGCRALV